MPISTSLYAVAAPNLPRVFLDTPSGSAPVAAGHSNPPTPEGTEACGAKGGIHSNPTVLEGITGQGAGAHEVDKWDTGKRPRACQIRGSDAKNR